MNINNDNSKRSITLDEQKKIELQIMDSINKFCEDNGIRYYLAGGSLLGAVRHSGFIPWDDDMDIVMPRDDYKKFLDTFNNNRTDPYRLVWYGNTDGYHLSWAKVIDTRTIMVERSTQYMKIVDFSVNIDVFPLDICPNSQRKIQMLWKREWILTEIILGKHRKGLSGLNWRGKIVCALVKLPGMLFSEEYLLQKKDRIASKYKNIKDPKYVAALIVMTYGKGEIHRYEWYGDGIKLLFEGREYNVPCDYDEILSHLYGDYMTPPPPEKRVSPHTVAVYWKDGYGE